MARECQPRLAQYHNILLFSHTATIHTFQTLKEGGYSCQSKKKNLNRKCIERNYCWNVRSIARNYC